MEKSIKGILLSDVRCDPVDKNESPYKVYELQLNLIFSNQINLLSFHGNNESVFQTKTNNFQNKIFISHIKNKGKENERSPWCGI